MNLFAQLHHHAQTAPTSIAVSSRYRPVTYRKLWSRIQRATARLQAEWQIEAGDVVAYLGTAHPDALVLYLGLLRSGASLLAVPRSAWSLPHGGDVSERLRRVLANARVKRLIVEDHVATHHVLCQHVSSYPALQNSLLSSLITTRCPQQPFYVIERAVLPGLVAAPWPSGAPLEASEPLVLAADGHSHQLSGDLFEARRLQAGETLTFA